MSATMESVIHIGMGRSAKLQRKHLLTSNSDLRKEERSERDEVRETNKVRHQEEIMNHFHLTGVLKGLH